MAYNSSFQVTRTGHDVCRKATRDAGNYGLFGVVFSVVEGSTHHPTLNHTRIFYEEITYDADDDDDDYSV